MTQVKGLRHATGKMEKIVLVFKLVSISNPLSISRIFTLAVFIFNYFKSLPKPPTYFNDGLTLGQKNDMTYFNS